MLTLKLCEHFIHGYGKREVMKDKGRSVVVILTVLYIILFLHCPMYYSQGYRQNDPVTLYD